MTMLRSLACVVTIAIAPLGCDQKSTAMTSTSTSTSTTGLYDTATPRGSYRDVEATAVAAAGADGATKVKIIDVREPAEWSGELGHIAGTELVPQSTLLSAAKDWEHDEEIVLVCRSGNRSARAAAELVKLGFTRVMNLKGGMIAWNAAGLRVER